MQFVSTYNTISVCVDMNNELERISKETVLDTEVLSRNFLRGTGENPLEPQNSRQRVWYSKAAPPQYKTRFRGSSVSTRIEVKLSALQAVET
jgi:hypothetical protein